MLTKKSTFPAFTIIELLVVIVVIGILASITIVSYTGVYQKAIEASLQSDLTDAKTKLQMYAADYGSYPTTMTDTDGTLCPSAPTVDNNYCIKPSPGNTFTYSNGTTTTFTLDNEKVGTTTKYQITDSTAPTLVAVAPQNAGVVTTLAGSGTPGFVDGIGTVARFNASQNVAVDSSGNVYVADRQNHRIRKVTPAGVVTTLAGSGTATFADGTGTAASFNNPQSLAVDSSGNVYVADRLNHRIRKVTPAGVVTTLAGNGTSTFADGTGTAAGLGYPSGMAFDSLGNIYLFANSRVRKIE